MTTHPKRPRDPAQLAKLIVDIATGEVEDVAPQVASTEITISPLGKKGGIARAEKLTPEQRKQIARKAATLRWAAKVD